MIKKSFLIILIIAISLLLNNGQAFAALVTCDPEKPAGAGSCDLCALFQTIQNVVNFLIGAAFSMVTIMLIYGGISMYFSGGNPENTKKATKVLINAVIGLVIVLTSWMVINTIITFLAKPGSPPTFWIQIKCTPSFSNECSTIGEYKCGQDPAEPYCKDALFECMAVGNQEKIKAWTFVACCAFGCTDGVGCNPPPNP
ncbi:MAG TPA: pilin [Candidatus Paceibacterota bacterium]|jgi:type IV secretory pathway VirB2 component (pilin)|nr:pilin [Candidatus Paceibacterota bacterium]HRS47844.1 pilin [Candidatus Paceibacterota bacterium]